MAKAYTSNPVKDRLRAHSPAERHAIRRAIRLLENDIDREEGKVDFMMEEQGVKIWGFFSGNVSLAFVDGPDDDITVVHAEMLSHFGHPGAN